MFCLCFLPSWLRENFSPSTLLFLHPLPSFLLSLPLFKSLYQFIVKEIIKDTVARWRGTLGEVREGSPAQEPLSPWNWVFHPPCMWMLSWTQKLPAFCGLDIHSALCICRCEPRIRRANCIHCVTAVLYEGLEHPRGPETNPPGKLRGDCDTVGNHQLNPFHL